MVVVAGGPQVGTAWVQITPSFQGFGSNIMSEVGRELSSGAGRAGEQAGEAAGREFGSSFEERASAAAERMGPIGTAAGVGIAGALGVGLAAAMDASSATAKLTAQLGLTEAEAARVGAISGEVFSAGFGESMGEVSEAVGAVTSSVADLGATSDAELQQLTTTALGLAETFQWDVGEAATAAGNLVKNGLAKDATDAFDVMSQAAKTLPASMRADIPAVVSEYGIHFSRIGLDAKTAFGMMSQYVEAGGRDIDQAADVLHEFGRITSEETDRAAEGFKALGLDSSKMLSDIAKGGEPAEAALTATLDALRGVKDPAEQSALAVELFGDMAGEGVDALWAMDPATAAAASGMDKTAGSGKELTDALAADPARVFEGAMRDLTMSLAQELAPALAGVAGWVSDNEGAFKGIVFAVAGIALAVAGATAALRLYQGAIIAVRMATAIWTGIQWLLNAALWANPMTWVVLGIIALIAIIVLAIVYWNEIVAAVRAAWQWITEATGIAVEWLKVKLGEAWEWIKTTASAAWEAVKATIGGAWQWIKDQTGAAVDWVATKAAAAWEGIKGAAKAAWDGVVLILKLAWDTIVQIAAGAVLGLIAAISGAWSTIKRATSTAWATVKRSITDAVGRAYDSVKNAGSRFLSVGRDIVNGIVTGVRNAAGRLFGSLRDMASNALSAAKNALGIGSPSRLFADQIGQWIPAGVEVGIDAGQGDLDQRVERLVQTPDVPVVRAAVTTGAAASPAPVVIRADGGRASRVLLELLQQSIRTDLGGDVTRLGTR